MSKHILDPGRPSANLLRTGFHAHYERSGGVVVIRLVGELDMATVVQLRQAVTEALETAATSVVLDLSALTFVDSSGIGALVGASRRFQELGCSFALHAPTRSVLKALRLTGVDRLMPIEPQVVAPDGGTSA